MKVSQRIIGIGNDERGDDGIGRKIAKRLKEQLNSGPEVIELRGDCYEILEAWKGFEKVVIADAMVSSSPPGTVRRIDANQGELPAAEFQCSTHGMGLREAVELARSLGELPAELIIFAVEGKEYEDGTSLSVEAQRGIDEAVEKILKEIGHA